MRDKTCAESPEEISPPRTEEVPNESDRVRELRLSQITCLNLWKLLKNFVSVCKFFTTTLGCVISPLFLGR